MTDTDKTVPASTHPARKTRQIHGRRLSRPLTPVQARCMAEKLPALRIDLMQPPLRPLTQLFSTPVEDVWLEIGFGAGEHLLWQAEAHPKIGFIGCEPFLNGVAKVVRAIEKNAVKTIRLYDNDAHHVLDWLPEQSVGRVFVLFPDPWPKKRHRKRRLLTREGLSAIACVMRPGAQFRFATDIADYAEMVLEEIDAVPQLSVCPGQLPERPEDWPLTRYGEKAIAAGRDCRYFIFERIQD